MSTTTDSAAGLRVWAKGMYPTEAAVELLIRSGMNRGPWIKPADNSELFWFDTSEVDNVGYLSGSEYRLLSIAASLADSRATVALTDVLSGLGRENLTLVLAAVAHAAGSHEHSGPLVPMENGRWRAADGTSMGLERLDSLYPWPELS